LERKSAEAKMSDFESRFHPRVNNPQVSRRRTK
jgi:hypothetical protein